MNKAQHFEERKTFENTSEKTLQGILMAMEGIFGELSNKASDSLKLIDLGAKDNFAKNLEESISNPLQSLDNAYNSFKKSATKGKEILITKIVRGKKHLLKRAAFVNEQNATHVFIILKEDNEDNRDVFYTFLEKYESHEIFQDFPIIFHFINEELFGTVFNPIIINLSDEQAPKPERP